MNKNSCLLLLILCLKSSFAISHNLNFGYESRYISEGRDNFVGQAMNFIGYQYESDSNKIFVWHGQSDNGQLGETTLALTKKFQLDTNILADLTYGYLKFRGSGTDDHELTISLSFGDGDGFVSRLSTTFGHQSSGFYTTAETSYQKSFKLMTLSSYISLGVNNEYIKRAHNGIDHYLFGVRLAWEVGLFEFESSYSFTQPVNDKGNEGLVEEEWFGLKVNYQY